MGNKASTARKLQSEVSHKSDSFVRSKVNQLPSSELKQKFIDQQQGPKPNVPQVEGKDGFDPQMTRQESRDFIDTITSLGRVIESSSDVPHKQDSVSIDQLKNRKKLETSTQEFSAQQLTALLNEIHDLRYTKEQVLKDYDLSDSWLLTLNRFKVANTYKEFKEHKKDEITHHGIFEDKTLIDEELLRESRLSDESSAKALEDRISVDK
ncbi:hypothetical protein PSN45_001913 [Yamadazyma tenuis]|uniref:Uncharacterized protein n=1 Tax=Candida tenuis (strain ATCC 10573 / BCRC 21748 / CBS 615 / JCM 9827 / NBRC 10315 / NRRL Y-1498 / VKM Y-70) TaxID=590646 RepID=G3BDL8_CANTC|nr:uncharacterized protein CANTEDRAFT_95780 [Yamadazyma tenuis ATCC 10573]EGV60333.1 hypothetical protein CANTEDRAFT_95780 [Yamadazyma tenuis ATCC 10573]WEJ94429.1 hypothetical protein PSN45_001913 [Yamadazyma tenuis]